MHDTNIELISQILDGKQISLVCGGGIGSIEMPRVARALRRHGAKVQFVVTEKCLNFIGKTSLEWASQNVVVIEPTGLSEHVCTSDAVLVAPATADIIAKARHGLCTDGAATIIQSAFGRKIPVGFMPTMHHSLWDSPCVQANCAFLKTIEGVFFLESRQEEQKEKMPPPDQLALSFAHYVNKLLHKDRKPVAITLGGTRTMIDPVRCITNLSTGRLGWEAVKLFYGMGHDTTAIIAHTNFELQKYQDLKLYVYPEYCKMFDFVKNFNFANISGFFHFLAASDFEPSFVEKNKMSSATDDLFLHLQKTEKIRDLQNLKMIPYNFFCKLESTDHACSQELMPPLSMGTDEILNKMKSFMHAENIQSLLWNSSQGAWNKDNMHNGFFVSRNQNEFSVTPVSTKKEIVQKIYEDYTVS